MAILTTLPGIEVTICVDGQPLTEYVENEEGEVKADMVSQHQASRTVSKFIEAVTDKEFAVQLSVEKPYKLDCPALGFTVFVDEREVAHPLLKNSWYLEAKNWKRSINGVKVEESRPGFERAFKFAEIIKTTDEDELPRIKEQAYAIDNIGTISVWVHRRSEGIPVDRKRPVRDRLVVDYGVAVHEKALKGQAKSHGTTLGDARPATTATLYKTTVLDGDDYPIAIFNFHYRSREDLKSLLIIERSPSPDADLGHARSGAPAPDPAAAMPALQGGPPAFDVSKLTPQEQRHVERFLAELRGNDHLPIPANRPTTGENSASMPATPQRVKREDSQLPTPGSIKRERVDTAIGSSSGSRKRARRQSFVDLTKDD